ncbi:hypothetical protein HOI30_02720, partial [Candidatus Woesearchaeota archaeon]|nr:hypothetical protein [Candidatus Woesearchaeota archaeon]
LIFNLNDYNLNNIEKLFLNFKNINDEVKPITEFILSNVGVTSILKQVLVEEIIIDGHINYRFLLNLGSNSWDNNQVYGDVNSIEMVKRNFNTVEMPDLFKKINSKINDLINLENELIETKKVNFNKIQDGVYEVILKDFNYNSAIGFKIDNNPYIFMFDFR